MYSLTSLLYIFGNRAMICHLNTKLIISVHYSYLLDYIFSIKHYNANSIHLNVIVTYNPDSSGTAFQKMLEPGCRDLGSLGCWMESKSKLCASSSTILQNNSMLGLIWKDMIFSNAILCWLRIIKRLLKQFILLWLHLYNTLSSPSFPSLFLLITPPPSLLCLPISVQHLSSTGHISYRFTGLLTRLHCTLFFLSLSNSHQSPFAL